MFSNHQFLAITRITGAPIVHRTGRPLTQAVLTLGVLCVLCGSMSAQEWKTVADGVEYAQVRREFSGKPVDINLLRLDLTKVRLDVHHAMDMAIGTEKTSSIATRHGAFAAINAGFFRLDTSIWVGDAAGTLMIDGELLSESHETRATLAIANLPHKTVALFGNLRISPVICCDRGQTMLINGVNRERKENEVIAYTPKFGATTLTNTQGVEVSVQGDKVVALSRDGSNLIPNGGFILSGSGVRGEELFTKWKVGKKLRLTMAETKGILSSIGSPTLSSLPYMIGEDVSLMGIPIEDVTNGVSHLVRESRVFLTWEQEKASRSFVETRHPRTAVAKLKDGKFLMLTADGRTDESAGLDLYDLAKYMLELSAVDAMNLDGGGSTTMFLDGKVVNKPSDATGERKVGDAILVTLRKPLRKPAR